MKNKLVVVLVLAITILACNKEKKLMKGLVGNWTIVKSERAVIHSDGSEDFYEDAQNRGKLVISDDEGGSDEKKKFSFEYYGPDNDTLFIESILSTDEKNKRIVFEHALCDSSTFCDVIWTMDKSKKNKMIWSVYGVDSTFYYPTDKFNPGSADNWLMWRITLKRDRSGFSGS